MCVSNCKSGNQSLTQWAKVFLLLSNVFVCLFAKGKSRELAVRMTEKGVGGVSGVDPDKVFRILKLQLAAASNTCVPRPSGAEIIVRFLGYFRYLLGR